MSITELSIKRPILVVVFFLVLAGAGIFSFTRLNYELLPNLATPFVTVATIYPGASPKEVENSVTKKIEEAVAGVSKIKKVTSYSAENISAVSIEFIADANADEATQETQRAISKILPELPIGVKTPSIEKLNVNDLPVLRLGVTGSTSDVELYNTIKNQIKPRLIQLKIIGRITILGGSETEIKITLNQSKLFSLNISPLEVSEAIRKNNNDFPIGTIKDVDAGLAIRINGKLEDLSSVENIQIKSFADGSSILLKDIAKVSDGTKETEVWNRVNGKSSIGLFVSKQSGANAVEIAKNIKNELKKLEAEYSNINLKFSIAQDTSEFTVEAANAVYKDFGIAILLVALVMLVFLHSLRNAAIVMLAIPTSLFSAFILLYFLNYSLNLMTLLAMSLVIGILVDDSIVVLENIYRHLELGKNKVKASLDGRNEIGFAALSITLVDVVVFLPMALVPGLVGSLVKQFSLVIVISTLSSLIVSFTLTPMIASRFAKLEHLNNNNWFGKLGIFLEKKISSFTNWYKNILTWSLKNKLATLGITLALLIGSLMLVTEGFIGSEFAPTTDKGELSLLINMQPGTKLSTTNDAVLKVENELKKIKEITKTFTNVGYMNDGFADNYASNVAAINIAIVPSKNREKSLADLGREIRAIAMQVPGVKARVSAIGLFGANDAPIQLLVYGTDRDKVLFDAEKILDTLRTVSGIANPRLSIEKGKPEMEIVIDRAKAALLGINPDLVGANLRTAINGYDELKFKIKENEVAVRVLFDDTDKASTNALDNYSFMNDKGLPIYLNQFARITLKNSASVLERVKKQNSVLILAQVVGKPSGDVGKDIQSKMGNYTFQDGVKLSYEGDLALQDDGFGLLAIALLSSIILMYLIMVTLYNNWLYPFVNLFSIPVALVGAFLALALTGKSLSIFTIFGLIMLMGLVAKNAILLVDRANQNLEDTSTHYSLVEALIEAGTTRLRPILMTTLAMVIGMLPLALAKGAGAELNSGLAWVLIGGLSSSMFLTLLVVPVMYYSVIRLSNIVKQYKCRKPNIQTILFFLLSFGLTSNCIAQNKKISLKDAESLALSQNKQIKFAEIESVKAKLATAESKGNLLPNISLSNTYNRNIKVPIFFFPTFGADPVTGAITIDDKKLSPVAAASRNTFNTLLNFSMPIFNSEINNGIQLAKSNESLVKANELLTKSQIIDEVRKAFYNVYNTPRF